MNEYGEYNVYVSGLPRQYDEHAVRAVFHEFGPIASIRMLKDDSTGLFKGSCFLRYKSLENAQAAIEGRNRAMIEGEPEYLVVRFAENRSSQQPQRQPIQQVQLVAPYYSQMAHRLAAAAGPMSDPRMAYAAAAMSSAYGDPYQQHQHHHQSHHHHHSMHRPMPLSMLDPATCLFVGGLPYSYREAEVQTLFGPYGQIVNIKVVTDKATNRSKGVCFVNYATVEQATDAIRFLNDYQPPGSSRRLQVQFKNATPQAAPDSATSPAQPSEAAVMTDHPTPQ